MNIEPMSPPNRPVMPDAAHQTAGNRQPRRLPQGDMGRPAQASATTHVVRQRPLGDGRPTSPFRATSPAPPAHVGSPPEDDLIFSLDMQASSPPTAAPPRSLHALAADAQPAGLSVSLRVAAQRIRQRRRRQDVAQANEARRQNCPQHQPLRQQLGFDVRQGHGPAENAARLRPGRGLTTPQKVTYPILHGADTEAAADR